MSSIYGGRLRKEPRRRTILPVSVVRPVGVEMELAVVTVEDRSVHELAIAVRILLLPFLNHQKLRFTA